MIFGTLPLPAGYSRVFPEPLAKALRFLADSDAAGGPDGRVEIDGEDCFALLSNYETEPWDSKRPEAHAKYVDVQYLAKGTEVIGVAPNDPALLPLEDCLEERDIAFYPTVANERPVTLLPGDFLILFPGEFHRPGCQAGETCRVRKVVVKIRASLLVSTG